MSKQFHINVAALMGGLGIAMIIAHFTNAFRVNLDESKPWGARPAEVLYFSNLKYFQDQAPSFKQSIRVRNQISKIEFGMVALEKLPPGKSIENTAVEIFKDWQIGASFEGKGILILYSQKDAALKIEVSYALEGNYTDAQIGRLQDMAATFFRSGHSADSFSELLASFSEQRDVASTTSLSNLSGGAGATSYNFEESFATRMQNVAPLSKAEFDKYQPSKTAEETAARYIQSLEAGIGDPRLPLLTEGAQYMSLEYPRSSNYQMSLAQRIKSVSPYKVVIKDDLAALRFQRDAGIFPIYMRKTDLGYWLVDVPKSFAYTQLFEDSEQIYHKNNTHPFIFAFPETLTKPNLILGAGRTQIPELIKYPFNLKKLIKESEIAIDREPQNADRYFKLAELMYFECYWMQNAVDILEKGLKLNPNAKEYHWLATEIYANIPNITPIREHWEAILRIDPNDAQARKLYKHYLKSYFPGDKRISEL